MTFSSSWSAVARRLNENALKLASFHTGRSRIIAFRGAFHGRTSAAVNATDNEAIKAPINRNYPVTFLDINDLEAVRRELAQDDVAAVIIEGIQGVGGIPRAGCRLSRSAARALPPARGAAHLDEVQSGYGRSGRFFAFQHSRVRPDIITMAKGMGNGFPIGGVLIAPEIEPKSGMLGTTFGGSHLGVCRGHCGTGCDRAGGPSRQRADAGRLPDASTAGYRAVQ